MLAEVGASPIASTHLRCLRTNPLLFPGLACKAAKNENVGLLVVEPQHTGGSAKLPIQASEP